MTKPRLRDLADRLAWARAVSGLSALALSQRAKISKAHVGLIESRIRQDIALKTAQSLAGALGISWSWLLSGEGDAPTEEQIHKTIAGAA